MKITLVAVVSANGKLTKDNDPDIYKWTSKEDQDFFFDQIKKAKLIIMGSGTYNVVRSSLNLKYKDKLRVVLTKEQEKYLDEQKDNALEFSAEPPKQVFERLSQKYEEALLVGGAQIYSSFAKEGLIDDIYVTIEPIIFGEGKPLFAENRLNINLKLQSMKKLNSQGTLLLHYKVEK